MGVVVALFGRLGSGKSSFASMLTSFGAYHLDLDILAHEVCELPEVKSEIAAYFGSDIVQHDGSLNRYELAHRAFSTSEACKQLNAITHPAIFARCEKELEYLRDQHTFIVAEVSAGPLLHNYYAWADVLCAVVCSDDKAQARACARNTLSQEQIHARLRMQPTVNQLTSFVDFVIDNSGTQTELRAKAYEFFHQVSKSFSA